MDPRPTPKAPSPCALARVFALLFALAGSLIPNIAAADPPPRPPPLGDKNLNTQSTPWQHHADLGADFAFISRLVSHDIEGQPNPARYEPAPGFGARIDWRLFGDYLRFNAYLLAARHALKLPKGALGPKGAALANQDYDFASYSFGARLCPALPLPSRLPLVLFACSGIGWGRLEFGRMQIQAPQNAAPYAVRERSSTFAEIPIGLGASLEIIPNWLALRLEIAASIPFGQEGSATHSAQIIDDSGQIQHVNALPVLDASFTQTLGLSLLL